MDISDQYQMKPRPGCKFIKKDVEAMLEEVLTQRFTDVPYSWDDSAQFSKEATADIQEQMEGMGYRRYKFVVQVTIAEAAQQGIRIASRCLWDPDVDNYAEFTFSTQHMHVNALVFGLYWE
eukprot:Tbor_TRINITY_DN5693_c1_g2::TRINITY_DN5693_c1_g2_i1::g.9258::m.9258